MIVIIIEWVPFKWKVIKINISSISPNSIPNPVKRHRYWLATTNTSNYCSIIPTHPYIQWLHRLDREESVTSK